MDTPEKKTSVLFYTDWAKPLRSLPMEDVGQLFCAILEYTETGAVPRLDSPVAAMAWEFIRQRLDASIEKWDATREKRRQAGRRRYRRRRCAGIRVERRVASGILGVYLQSSHLAGRFRTGSDNR